MTSPKASDAITLQIGIRPVRNIDVEQPRIGRQAVVSMQQFERDPRGGIEMRRRFRSQRNRDRRNPEQEPFGGRGDGAGVDVSSPMLAPWMRDHHVGQMIEQTGDGKMHAIGRRSIHEQEPVRRTPHGQRSIERQRVRSPAAIAFRRDHGDLGVRRECRSESLESRRKVAVVVGKQNAHEERMAT